MNYETIKRNYLTGLWARPMVLMAVKKGVITMAQAQEIFASATDEASEGESNEL